MKQRVIVTREQLTDYLGMSIYVRVFGGAHNDYVPFPDSIEVEVDVPEQYVITRHRVICSKCGYDGPGPICKCPPYEPIEGMPSLASNELIRRQREQNEKDSKRTADEIEAAEREERRKLFQPKAPLQNYKLMAPAVVIKFHTQDRGDGLKIRKGNGTQELLGLFESEPEAIMGVIVDNFCRELSAVEFVSWPATIDPATGMYKVPTK